MNHYERLSVARDADAMTIKRAFRVMAKRWHPDRHPGRKGRKKAETRFKKIQEAYRTLIDPERRKQYDSLLDTGLPDPKCDQCGGSGYIGGFLGQMMRCGCRDKE